MTRTPTTPARALTPARAVADERTFAPAKLPVLKSPDRLFTLKTKVGLGSVVVIHAFEGGKLRGTYDRIDVEVRHNGAVIFPRGVIYCGTHGSTKDAAAKELVMSLLAVKPGDVDPAYFEGYSPAQLEWVRRFAEEIDLARQDRFCDPATGALREAFRNARPSQRPRR